MFNHLMESSTVGDRPMPFRMTALICFLQWWKVFIVGSWSMCHAKCAHVFSLIPRSSDTKPPTQSVYEDSTSGYLANRALKVVADYVPAH